MESLYQIHEIWTTSVKNGSGVVTFLFVSCVRCGAWLYRILIFVLFLTSIYEPYYRFWVHLTLTFDSNVIFVIWTFAVIYTGKTITVHKLKRPWSTRWNKRGVCFTNYKAAFSICDCIWPWHVDIWPLLLPYFDLWLHCHIGDLKLLLYFTHHKQ